MDYVLVFITGLLLGSFYNVCIYRIPRNMSISYPPSRCSACGHQLAWMDLFPLLSFILLQGRCRYCHAKIAVKYPLVELLTAVLLVVLLYFHGISWLFLVYSVLTSILIISTFIDLEHQIIPNGLVLIGTVFGVIFILLTWSVTWLDGLLGLLAGGGSFLLVALLSVLILKKEGMGGGDIKLMGMIGLFIGWKLTLLSILFSIYLGGIIGAILLITRIKKRGEYIPYGPFIAAGTFLAILFGHPIITWYFSRFIG